MTNISNSLPSIAPRDTFGQTLVELGSTHKNLVVLDADLSSSTKTSLFKKRFPNRFLQMGIAEQNMIGAAAGLATQNFIPVVSTFAAFASRAWEQFRLSVAISNKNVKLVVTHAGVSIGPDGVSAQMTEDISLFRSLPNVIVLSPADAQETKLALKAAVKHQGPVFIRLGRSKLPQIFKPNSNFKLGKAKILIQGQDISIIATGSMVCKALEASALLKRQNITTQVINLSTIKPLDKKLILRSALKTGAFVTVEEHQQAGGMGSAVAELISQTHPIPIQMVAIKDVFGESGTEDQLLIKTGLTTSKIVTAAKKVLTLKQQTNNLSKSL